MRINDPHPAHPDPHIGSFDYDESPAHDDVVYSQDPDDLELNLRRTAAAEVRREQAVDAHRAAGERALEARRRQERAAARARGRDGARIQAPIHRPQARAAAHGMPGGVQVEGERPCVVGTDGVRTGVTADTVPVPDVISSVDAGAPAPRGAIGCAGSTGRRAVHDERRPPWERLPVPALRAEWLYTDVRGGPDEPPGMVCTECGMAGGGHRARCPVEAYEADAYARWEDAQRETGNPAVWANVVASEDHPAP